MAIMYSLSQRQPGEEKLYFANVQSTGVVSTDELCQRISMYCGLKKSVLKSALLAFSKVMKEELVMGKIVDLGEIGKFQVSCSSCGVERKEDFCSSKYMKGAKILFRPSRGLKEMLKWLRYERVAVK